MADDEWRTSTVRGRVTFPTHTLLVTVFNGWKFFCGAERREQAEQELYAAAHKIQGRARKRSQQRNQRKKAEAAANIQARHRGKHARRKHKATKDAATTIQAHVRGRKTRNQQPGGSGEGSSKGPPALKRSASRKSMELAAAKQKVPSRGRELRADAAAFLSVRALVRRGRRSS